MVGQGTIVATGSIAYPVGLGDIGAMIGAEKVMTMTSTYDHRIIQGAESGRFLQVIEAYLQGENGFYDGRLRRARRSSSARCPPPPAPAAAAAARERARAGRRATAPSTRSCCRPCRPRPRCSRPTAPTATSPRGWTRWAPTPSPTRRSSPSRSGLTPELMAKIPAKILRMYVPGATLADALPHLRETYCGTIAYEIEHIASHRQRMWLRENIESGTFRKPLTNDEQRALLKRLIEVDAFERFMHKAYLGQKQFSVEGLDMTVPMLDEMIQLVGRPRRARGRRRHGPPRPAQRARPQPRPPVRDDLRRVRGRLDARGGDHDPAGRHRRRQVPPRRAGLLPAAQRRVDPRQPRVQPVAPRVRAPGRRRRHARRADRRARARTPTATPTSAVPIVLHGDAAFPGQGVVAESLNLQALDGYKVGGTIHLIQNNQIGFTTDPEDARSTRWASDIAKGYDVPIIHVNADDVAACIAAVRLAFAFRQEFGHDVVIDLIGYRRFGHNEADEPAYTQPEMYAKIKSKKRVSELFADAARRADGVITQEEVERAAPGRLGRAHAPARRSSRRQIKAAEEAGAVEQPTGEYQLDRSPSPEVQTAVSAERLLGAQRGAADASPTASRCTPSSSSSSSAAAQAVGADGGIDWAHAESLAFASLLTEGVPIRLTGQDAERGTFSQRHLVLHDAKTGQTRLARSSRCPARWRRSSCTTRR